ncbi:MAG: 1-acyl-sn-glycerol-3-phosphate acyltransferase [Acidobacteriota bacterium]
MPTTDLLDDMTRAILQREEVVRLLRGSHGGTPADAGARVHAYLDELRTTQRYQFYRALQHPLYPILRKITRNHEHLDKVKRAIQDGRVIYVSNHRSHIDYLVEPLVLDDNGIRPPLIAAGINLFGGPLGLLHRHVTGAIPIRRNTKDPVYLVTLQAYIAELLTRRDLLFYLEGGRSYSGELKPAKTGLFRAALQSGVRDLLVVPTAISYDLVLEDWSLARQGVKRRQRPFTREIAEMMRSAVGYRSRAFVVFGDPIPLSEYDGESRRDLLGLAHRTRDAIGRLFKVLPTALVAAAMRPSSELPDLEDRVAALVDRLRAIGANLGVESAAEAVETGAGLLEQRGIIHLEPGRARVRNRAVLKYYSRSLNHLLAS